MPVHTHTKGRWRLRPPTDPRERQIVVYYFELLGTAVFAITGVLVVTRRGLDAVGALMLGVVTALGGGSIRDLMIRAPIFWLEDFNYVWAAMAGSLAAFFIGHVFRGFYRFLLYLDALGVALFAVSAANKVMMLQFAGPIAVIMGVLTGIGGGLLRDVLAGRQTLLMSREIYATPILLGCTVFVGLRRFTSNFAIAGFVASLVIFGFRALAIHFHWEMPAWLTHKERPALPVSSDSANEA
jgi:uncharacterized membrane protein YeiH